MIGSSTFEAWCACTRIRGAPDLSIWSSIYYPSSRIGISSSVSIEPGSIEVHGDQDVVHAPWSISRVILRVTRPRWVGLGLIIRAIVIPHISEGAIIVLESSSLVVALEISKRSSSEPRSRNERRSISLCGLIGLRTLSKNIL